MSEYKICKRCIMDTTSDVNLVLDENGVCNYCHEYDENVKKNAIYKVDGDNKLKKMFEDIKKECAKDKYDIALGISGGVDSSYLLHLCKLYDMRVLAIHVDCGWNSELAVKNIEAMCTKCGYDLHTVVMDWNVMKELQRAYLFSGLGNQDVPQDHCFHIASLRMCKKYKVKYLINGYNLSTEGILSHAYQQNPHDWINIKDVYKKCGRGKVSLRKYIHCNFIEEHFLVPYLYPVKTIRPLLYVDYTKRDAIALLEKEYDWKYYGGKHYESRFTRFFQEVYLPKKYGWEKRRDHISSLIVGGEMTREEGLKEIETPTATPAQIEEEIDYILKKLDVSREEWEAILDAPNKTINDYKNEEKYMDILRKIKHIFGKKNKK